MKFEIAKFTFQRFLHRKLTQGKPATTSQSGRHKNRAWKRRTSFIAKEKVSNRNLPLEATGVSGV